MIHPPWMEASLEGPIAGSNRLQIYELFAQFCRDLPIYLVDIVHLAMSPVQFKTRHSLHFFTSMPASRPVVQRKTW
jgi:hypothetical protein